MQNFSKKKILLKKISRGSNLWNKSKHTNIYKMGIQKGKEKEKGTERIFEEIMSECFQEFDEKHLRAPQLSGRTTQIDLYTETS